MLMCWHLFQGDNSAMWLHGSGSRATSALAPGHFYGFQGQSQLGGFRQAQQPQPSQFGGHGYPTFYQSQGGLAQEHPQNLAEGSLNGFPAAPSQQSHQSWQHQHTYWALHCLLIVTVALSLLQAKFRVLVSSSRSKQLRLAEPCNLSAERPLAYKVLESVLTCCVCCQNDALWFLFDSELYVRSCSPVKLRHNHLTRRLLISNTLDWCCFVSELSVVSFRCSCAHHSLKAV